MSSSQEYFRRSRGLSAVRCVGKGDGGVVLVLQALTNGLRGFGVRRTDKACPAIDCQVVLWSGFKFAFNARRYKAQ
jgi:hypothetical protein